ncbi:MAG: PAS domain S-box protein [Terracidiphilus sp.]
MNAGQHIWNAFAVYLQAWVPSFDAKVRRKDGVHIPVMLHISGLRDAEGELTGMVAVAVDQSENLHRDHAQRESQERYRDLFEHSSEMIATLSPAGQFLYANPAWKRCFGLEQTALLDLRSFEDLFSDGVKNEVAALFRRALDGEMVERIPLSHHTPDGRRARTGIEPQPPSEDGRSIGRAMLDARCDSTEASRKSIGSAIGREPDRRR